MTSSKDDYANYDRLVPNFDNYDRLVYDRLVPNFDMTYKTIKRVFVPNLKSFGATKTELRAKEVREFSIMLYEKMAWGHSLAHHHGCHNINVWRSSKLSLIQIFGDVIANHEYAYIYINTLHTYISISIYLYIYIYIYIYLYT